MSETLFTMENFYRLCLVATIIVSIFFLTSNSYEDEYYRSHKKKN